MAKEMPKWMYPVNAAVVLGVIFLIPSLGNIGSDEAAGKLDENCDPFIGYVVASWVTPGSFWKKQAAFYGKAINEPFQPPSVRFREPEAMAAQAGAKEKAMLQQIRAEQPRDLAQEQANALRAAADRIEHEAAMRPLDEQAAKQYVADKAHAQQCLNKAKQLSR